MRCTPDVNVYGIAGPQQVVLRRGQIHAAFEGQVLVVEHVVTENLSFAALLLLQLVFQRVGHHEVNGLIHFYEIPIAFVIRMALNLVRFLGIFDTEL